MAFLTRVGDVVGRPVVTLGGDVIAQIKDVVLDPGDGRVTMFTLSGRGLLSGPLREVLHWEGVHALGMDAVMVAARSAVAGPDESRSVGAPDAGVSGARVLTAEGEDMGRVADVVLDVEQDAARMVGYEVRLGDHGAGEATVLLPVPLPAAASGENVVVPEASFRFAVADLAGFREAAAGLEQALKEAR
ncbi:PRC-barrel domain protein [Streptomyces venezuelae]|uniref:PRC-barrel domain protein n=1 Tax=Streptomyces venezuelae TaxID=54571 RepID=A0A5P2DS31_STRVZ|nr:PRC-barrel domain-containing protein [Streptomyces venezuelae]QES57982.1 PRC-barrel domain protein [Streptomyces venezuelae]